LVQTVHRLWLRFLPIQIILITAAIGLTIGVTGAMIVILLHGDIQPAPLTAAPVNTRPQLPANGIGFVFTPSVQYWAPRIAYWSQQYGVDPNMVATVMQIESCGDFTVGSVAGAQGLLQLMPDHFQAGEDPHDPDTNIKRGIEYLKAGLVLADGHIGLAMAGYNGGNGIIPRGWAGFPTETKRYYLWATQIYLDAINGKKPEASAALQSWLSAGGSKLCAQAYDRLFPTPTPLALTPSATVQFAGQ
jgi:hypothetical protein